MMDNYPLPLIDDSWLSDYERDRYRYVGPRQHNDHHSLSDTATMAAVALPRWRSGGAARLEVTVTLCRGPATKQYTLSWQCPFTYCARKSAKVQKYK